MKKKVLLIPLILLYVIISAACSPMNLSEPNFDSVSDKLILPIGGWIAPPPNFVEQERYDEIAESGLNFIIENYTGTNIAKALEYCENAGIGYYVRGMGMSISSYQSFYKDYKSFRGYYVYDEPGASKYDELAVKHEEYKLKFPKHDYYINLFPVYAQSNQLQTNNYIEYVESFIEKVKPKFLSYDHYAFRKDAWGKPYMRNDMLYNLEVFANAAKNAGIPFWVFMQSMNFGDYRAITEADIRFQSYVYLAYGCTGLQHFCYWTPLESNNGLFSDDTPALITRTGEKTDTYYAVKQVNSELLNFDHVLLSFKWEGVMPVLADKSKSNNNFALLQTPLKNHGSIKSITSTEDVIVGAFKSGGYNGFLAVNFTDPALGLENEIEIVFNGYSKAVIYDDGIKEVITLDRGKYTTKLDSGEGKFIIPFN